MPLSCQFSFRPPPAMLTLRRHVDPCVLIFVLMHLLSAASPAFALTCQEAVQAATESIPTTLVGIEWPCCSRRTATCRTDLDDCNAEYPDFTSCFVVDGSTACQLTSSPSAGAPCGVYEGETGPPGVSAIAGHNLTFSGFEATVRANWTVLSVKQEDVVCCSAVTGSCSMAKSRQDDVNPCADGDYEILCAGDAQRGICSVYANKRQTQPIKAYFRVNLATSTSTSITGSETAPSTTSLATAAAPDGNPLQNNDARGRGPNLLAIALPIALAAVAAVALFAFFLLRRRRRQAQVHDSEPTPFSPSSQQPLSAPWGRSSSSYPATRGDSDPYTTSIYSVASLPSAPSPFGGPMSAVATASPLRSSGKSAVPLPEKQLGPAPPYSAD